MKVKYLLPLISILIINFITIDFTIAHAEGTGGRGGVGKDKVYVGAYYQDPGSGEWVAFDTGIPEDIWEYRFELKCFDDLFGDIDCLNQNKIACKAGGEWSTCILVYEIERWGCGMAPKIPGPIMYLC